MRALIQRVSEASVRVDGAVVGEIGAGLLILICAMKDDDDTAPARMAVKLSKMRVFRDAQDKMNLSLLDTGGSALIVSQFTLAATTKGNRPGFSDAAPPERGRQLYESFTSEVAALGIPHANGIFGADMKVALINDGPVTFWVEV
ncbi:D-aminoacyl-tRNA deacylase [Ketogulonicigenium vulgare]|uniref:D-aminoacyl-tRNA deacylase n=1 Tax=Ketogulonicigenium vulgare TaxID=92945 RepID=UPI00235A4190|nr:D-aminoacyl-tRNA deacylase [Ketogulonicigenium vulgare]